MSFRPLISPTTELTGTVGHRSPMRTLPEGLRVAGGQRPNHLVRRHVVGSQLAGIQANEDGALAGAKGRRRRHPRQSRKQWAHPEQRRVLELGDRFGLAGENEVADRHAARVEPHHKRRHGPCRHEGAGAVDVRDRLRRRLRHVRAGMELQLDERDALDRLAFDVLDAGDVEEVVLVVVGDEPFHLRRIQATVRLRHVQYRDPQIREDIPCHAIKRQKPRQCHRYDRDQKRDRPPQCTRHQIHRAASTGRPAWMLPATLQRRFGETRLSFSSICSAPEVKRPQASSRAWTANRLIRPGVCRPRRRRT
jgi:hypothetical protein